MRFDFGYVSDIRPPQDCRLTEIEGGGTAQFRLKVIDETAEHGCILAEADGIAPLQGDESATDRNSILPVMIKELEEQVWRVEFDTGDGRPVLELNKDIEGVSQIAQGDDHFFALVYPAVIREILHRVLRVEEFADIDGPSDDWRVQWLKFSCTLPGILAPPGSDEESDSIAQQQREWIEEVVAAFCARYEILHKFNQAHPSGAE